MRTILLIVVMASFLVLAGAIAAYAWWRMADVEMSTAGVLALVAGAALTLLLGIGLMALVFYSSRSGHDEAAGRHEGQPKFRSGASPDRGD